MYAYAHAHTPDTVPTWHIWDGSAAEARTHIETIRPGCFKAARGGAHSVLRPVLGPLFVSHRDICVSIYMYVCIYIF